MKRSKSDALMNSGIRNGNAARTGWPLTPHRCRYQDSSGIAAAHIANAHSGKVLGGLHAAIDKTPTY